MPTIKITNRDYFLVVPRGQCQRTQPEKISQQKRSKKFYSTKTAQTVLYLAQSPDTLIQFYKNVFRFITNSIFDFVYLNSNCYFFKVLQDHEKSAFIVSNQFEYVCSSRNRICNAVGIAQFIN